MEADAWTTAGLRRGAVLPEYLSEHVLLSAAAMGLGLALSLLLAIAAVRIPRVRWPVLAFASVVQTIPGLALLALFYPLLLALSATSLRVFGEGFSALGFLPALLALTLYSMLPVIRNGVAGDIESRSGHDRGRARRRYDGLATSEARRAAACGADVDGRRAHGCGLGHRRGDAVDARRADESRQLHLLGSAASGLGGGAVRLRCGGGARAVRRSAARPDRDGRGARSPARVAIGCARARGRHRRGRSCRCMAQQGATT